MYYDQEVLVRMAIEIDSSCECIIWEDFLPNVYNRQLHCKKYPIKFMEKILAALLPNFLHKIYGFP